MANESISSAIIEPLITTKPVEKYVHVVGKYFEKIVDPNLLSIFGELSDLTTEIDGVIKNYLSETPLDEPYHQVVSNIYEHTSEKYKQLGSDDFFNRVGFWCLFCQHLNKHFCEVIEASDLSQLSTQDRSALNMSWKNVRGKTDIYNGNKIVCLSNCATVFNLLKEHIYQQKDIDSKNIPTDLAHDWQDLHDSLLLNESLRFNPESMQMSKYIQIYSKIASLPDPS